MSRSRACERAKTSLETVLVERGLTSGTTPPVGLARHSSPRPSLPPRDRRRYPPRVMRCWAARRALDVALAGVILAACVDVHDALPAVGGLPTEPELTTIWVGIRHDSYAGRSGALRTEDTATAAAQGFGFVRPFLEASDESFLDEASNAGVRVLGALDWGSAEDVLDSIEGHPALFGWTIDDGINWGSDSAGCRSVKLTPVEVRDRHDWLKRRRPAGLTYASAVVHPSCEVAGYAGTVDVIGVQSFPIGQVDDAIALEQHAETFRQASDLLGSAGQSYVANLQAIAWVDRFPTPREFRNMAFAALVYGAKGFLVDSLYSFRGSLLSEDAPALWEAMPALVSEMRALEAIVSSATREPLPFAESNLHGALWRGSDQVIVIIVNTHRSEARTLDLSLPSEVGATLVSLFPSASPAPSWSEGRWIGAIDPEDVHVLSSPLDAR